MLSARNHGIFRAAFHAFVIAAMLAAAPVASAVGEGCTPAANTFCVTNTNDTTNTLSPDYAGSLRKAIADANTAGGTNTIGFNIPGSGVHTITLAAQLPGIANNLTIDGFSQPGTVQNTNAPDQGGINAQLTVEITTAAAGTAGFFYVCCGGPFLTLTFQGLVLHGFGTAISGQAATLTPKAQLNVYGCFIGTKSDGSALPALGNLNSAISAGYDNVQVGGTQAWQRNLLSGNGGAGVQASPSDAATTIVVEGNLIGTDIGGTQAIANGTNSNWPGVYILGQARNTRIGCTSAGSGCASNASRNVISGNHTFGIALAPDVNGSHFSGLEIKGNYIGVGWNGAALPNGFAEAQNAQFGGGIQVAASADTTPAIIGGFGPGESNLIAFNRGPGINAINFGSGNGSYFDSRANRLHDNTGPGQTNIALGFAASEPLANDAGDADAGSNNQQNWPEIYTAEPVLEPGGVSMNVTYRVTSAPANALYPIRVDFYFALNGGAGLWFAQDSYPDSALQGYVTASLPITLPVVGPGPWYAFWGPIVAIATNGSGYSSEISPVTNDWIFGDKFETAP